MIRKFVTYGEHLAYPRQRATRTVQLVVLADNSGCYTVYPQIIIRPCLNNRPGQEGVENIVDRAPIVDRVY